VASVQDKSAQEASGVARLVKLLSSPDAYPQATRSVRLVETHISWIFLTDRHVYKLKKPVRFDFLDFSTCERRRWACEQELRLNRRLAPDVYLDVLPVTATARGRLRLDGEGRPVDWVVRMKRLPEAKALDVLVRRQTVSDNRIDQLANVLSEFYRRLPPLTLTTDEYRRRLLAHIESNEQELLEPRHALPVPLVRRVHAAQRLLLRLAPDLLDTRVRDGRIVDGHGDLRPEHVYFTARPTIIDCLEFNEELRQIDVLDELAFLAMECESLRAAWIGERILQRYRESSGDAAPLTLFDFYKAYRACVRAKVRVLQAVHASSLEQRKWRDEAAHYLQLADDHGRRFGPPLLLVVYGLSGTGKSTLAERLATTLPLECLATDAIRRNMPGEVSTNGDQVRGRYDPDRRLAVYEEMFRRAQAALGDGRSVLLDGTFPSADLRRRAIALAREQGALPVLLHCQCPAHLAVQRIVDRGAEGQVLSEATPAVFEQQQQDFEADPADLVALPVTTEFGPDRGATTALQHLRSALLPV
jgi:uncharacterized protein